jgi:hypothetical protein
VFEGISPGEKLASIAVREGACPPEYTCSATGRVEGREQVEVPAGRFDAIKVSVEQLWRAGSAAGGSQAAQMNGGRLMTIWYAPKAKRAIKYSSRLTIGELPPFDVNFDLELTATSQGSGASGGCPPWPTRLSGRGSRRCGSEPARSGAGSVARGKPRFSARCRPPPGCGTLASSA